MTHVRPTELPPQSIVVIPARLASTRLPRKMLLAETGKPLIQHTYETASRARRPAGVAIATDHLEIAREVERFGSEYLMTSPDCQSGTDRVAEVAWKLTQADIFVIVQGDEPELAPEAIPGFQQHAFNVYDPKDIPRAAQALNEFQGGNLVIGIFGAPYKCPPAPYEMALLINDFLKSRGINASIEVFTPQPMSLPILGQVGCDLIESRLADHGITFLANHKATAIEAGEVVFGDKRRPFDLLLGVPPHRPPAVVRESRLVDATGWVPVNARTLETQFPGVYATGDVVQVLLSNGKALAKAGVFAEAMGETVADRIAAAFDGEEPEATFAGEGGCDLEVGAGQAMMVQGNFLAEPEPEVTLSEPSPAYMDEKRAFETQPSNPAIQAELQRLYGRRDGVRLGRRVVVHAGNYDDAVARVAAEGAANGWEVVADVAYDG